MAGIRSGLWFTTSLVYCMGQKRPFTGYFGAKGWHGGNTSHKGLCVTQQRWVRHLSPQACKSILINLHAHGLLLWGTTLESPVTCQASFPKMCRTTGIQCPHGSYIQETTRSSRSTWPGLPPQDMGLKLQGGWDTHLPQPEAQRREGTLGSWIKGSNHREEKPW